MSNLFSAGLKSSLAVTLALACGAFVLYLTTSGGPSTAGAAAVAKTSVTHARVADDSDQYSVLEGASGDAIAGWQVTRTPQFEALGLDLSRARVVYQDQAKTVAAVASRGTPCLLTRYPNGRAGVSCGVESGQPTALVSYTGAIGLVPDSTESVTYTMANGDVVSERVVNNVWQAPVDAAKVQFTLGDRTREVGLMPQSSLPDGARIVSDAVVQDNAPSEG